MVILRKKPVKTLFQSIILVALSVLSVCRRLTLVRLSDIVGMGKDAVKGEPIRDFDPKQMKNAAKVGLASGLVGGALSGDAAALGVSIENDVVVNTLITVPVETTNIVASEVLKEPKEQD